ncbi:hypothetical protein BDA99DRAFT_542021 [Phascolomyces articulosus]|uniref:Uncharacterized protein n=1 Tax=Phascolomyces articulosus TaxID=60185 RepID=A0AAD5JR25_9FUNG|nr:hypothetical protein BDA99DRAFT_542021 [Phascolomyces articulosus]
MADGGMIVFYIFSGICAIFSIFMIAWVFKEIFEPLLIYRRVKRYFISKVLHCIYNYFTPKTFKHDPAQPYNKNVTILDQVYCGYCCCNILCVFQIRRFWNRVINDRKFRLFYFCCNCILKKRQQQGGDDVLPFSQQQEAQHLSKMRNNNGESVYYDEEGRHLSLSPPPPVFLKAPPHTFPMSTTISFDSSNNQNYSRGSSNNDDDNREDLSFLSA